MDFLLEIPNGSQICRSYTPTLPSGSNRTATTDTVLHHLSFSILLAEKEVERRALNAFQAIENATIPSDLRVS